MIKAGLWQVKITAYRVSGILAWYWIILQNVHITDKIVAEMSMQLVILKLN